MINKNAVIGNNCNISQFITVGSTGMIALAVGDEFYIGPNSCKNITIGTGCAIGAGSTLVKTFMIIVQ